MKFFIIVFSIIVFITASMFALSLTKKESIKVGLLYSKSGTMSTNEKPLSDMLRAAVWQINKDGGVLGREIEIIEFDGKSDSQEFKKGAEELIAKGAVSIFGCWTSASRKEVKEVVEASNNVLFYPLQYEGFEESQNIVYLGLSANQQINPAIDFIQTNFGNDIYLVGSDYIYPKAANFYINELAKLTELNVKAERYYALNSTDFKDLFEDIKSKKPNAIINTLNGDSNIEFFKKLKENGITSNDIPVISLSVDEASLSKISKENAAIMYGHYAVWGYFDVMNKSTNEFSDLLRDRFEKDVVVTDAMFSIYLGAQFFKQALLRSKKITTEEILKNIKRSSINISGNIYHIDPDTRHLYRNVYIGKINTLNKFDIVWSSSQIINPQPYPRFKERPFWENKIGDIYKSYGNSWEAKSETR